MAQYAFSASALVPSSTNTVYKIIADYNQYHPLILPKPYFQSLKVEKGGVGRGTVISCEMLLMGSRRQFRASITEPQPGRRLVETIEENGTETTFLVEPRDGGAAALVTITTTVNVRDGWLGKIEGWMTRQMLHPIYVKELTQLAALARQMPG